jgi:hypothetical protein
MKNLVDTTSSVILNEPLIPANLVVLGLTTMDIEMMFKIVLTGLMIVLTGIKIVKEIKSNKNQKTDF